MKSVNSTESLTIPFPHATPHLVSAIEMGPTCAIVVTHNGCVRGMIVRENTIAISDGRAGKREFAHCALGKLLRCGKGVLDFCWCKNNEISPSRLSLSTLLYFCSLLPRMGSPRSYQGQARVLILRTRVNSLDTARC